jgi:hypothetical protein
MTAQTASSIEEASLGLSLVWEAGSPAGLPAMIFAQALDRRCLRYLRRELHAVGPDAAERLAALPRVVITRGHDSGETSVVEFDDDTVALVEIMRGSLSLEVAARDRSAACAACAAIATSLGVVENRDNEVPLTFWALSKDGPRSARRMIEAPQWTSIDANYSRDTRRPLHDLMKSSEPAGGRLVLWHGPPGTGKTNALKALAKSWSPWCSTHFITDPEAFLGAGTSYLLDVLATGTRGLGRGQESGWRLLVLEDSGELLTADAHQRTGQALSRLLNVTDGLVGQGLNALVLVTTNEPLRKLHPAVQRPGRCWSEIEFGLLMAEEANHWLRERRSTARVTGQTSLADLFAALDGQEIREQPTFGFAGA